MLCISLNHVIGRDVHTEVPPIGLGFWRWLLAVLIILPFIWTNRKKTFSIINKHLCYFTLAGLLLTISTTSILVALHMTTATNAAMMNSTQPLITVVLVWAFLNDELKWIQKLGVLLGFVGVVVMISKGS